MGNPFDQVIHVEDTKDERPRGKRRRGDTVTISLNKRVLERILFLAIIIILLVLYFTKPTGIIDTEESKIIEVTQPKEEPSTTIEVTSPQEEETEEENEPEPEEEEEESEPEEGSLSDLKVTFTDIDYLVISGDPLKMNKVSFQIKNDWKAFKPLAKLYWYDDDSKDEVKERVRGTASVFMLTLGEARVFTIEDFAFGLIDTGEREETVVLEIFDRDTDELLKRVTKTIP